MGILSNKFYSVCVLFCKLESSSPHFLIKTPVSYHKLWLISAEHTQVLSKKINMQHWQMYGRRNSYCVIVMSPCIDNLIALVIMGQMRVISTTSKPWQGEIDMKVFGHSSSYLEYDTEGW